MKPFPDLSIAQFKQFQTENMDPALALIGDGLKKEGLRNQFCARLLGYRAYEAIDFGEGPSAEFLDDPSDVPEDQIDFNFADNYGAGPEFDFTTLVKKEVDSLKKRPYPSHAHYLNKAKPVVAKLPASALLLSILPVLLDDRTPWREDVLSLFEMGLVRHAGPKAPCSIERKGSFNDYPGWMEMLSLLSETGMVPENLLGAMEGGTDLWINQHLKASLEQLNSEVKASFDKHLARIELVQSKGYGRSAFFKENPDVK